MTAEYSMLPRSTSTRTEREIRKGRPDARASEISRLVGRALRAAVDMDALIDTVLLLGRRRARSLEP